MKVLDNLRGVLHLEHFLSNPFPYQVLVQLSHPSRVEQAWHAINGNFAEVTWQIEHRNAFSNDWINDKENLCRKASSRIFPISPPWLFFHQRVHGFFYERTVSLYCRTATFPFLFCSRRCFFSVFSFGNGKKLAWTNSPKTQALKK